MKLLALLLIAFSLAIPASAAVYKTVRPDGSVVYSDQPPRDAAEPHPLPPLQTIPADNLAPTTTPQKNGGNNASTQPYHSLTITQPQQNGTVQSPPGNVDIQLALDPPLDTKQGDHVTVYLDGQPAAQGTDISYTLENVDRGAHTVAASVNSAPGQILIQSSPVTFFLHRPSINLPPRR